jgi:hypothetical protein
MITTHMEAQGLTSTDLRSQAVEVLSTLSEDHLLVVLAYARALAVSTHLPFPQDLRDDLLEELLEDRH